LPVVLYGCETWSLRLREEHRLRAFENRVLRRIFVPKRDILIMTGLKHEASFMEGLTLGRCYFLRIAFSVEVTAVW